MLCKKWLIMTYVHLHVCTYVSMYLCIYASMYRCIGVSMYQCIHAIIHASMFLYMYACMYLCVHVIMCVCEFVFVYARAFTCKFQTYWTNNRIRTCMSMRGSGMFPSKIWKRLKLRSGFHAFESSDPPPLPDKVPLSKGAGIAIQQHHQQWCSEC